MALPSLELDDRTYADLIQEARSLIPTYAPQWTDHNPSDPGIALLELFAWLTEMLLYRSQQVPERHVVAFLRLLNGPDWTWSPPDRMPRDALLAAEVRAAVVRLRSLYRATTAEDYTALALTAPSTAAAVIRATCVPRRHLASGLDADRPGHVTVLVVPDRELDEDERDGFHADVLAHLDARRLLTTHVHVAAPLYAPVEADVIVAPRADVTDERVTAAVIAQIERHLDETRWAFGRDVHLSELYERLETLPEVDYVPSVRLASPATGEPGTVPARELWHESGEPIGLSLGPYQLPRLTAAPTVLVGRAFVSVYVDADVHGAGGLPAALVRRAVVESLRELFDARTGGPDGRTAWGPVPRHDIEQRIAELPEVSAVARFEVRSVPDRDAPDTLGTPRLLIRQGELVSVHATVTVAVS